MATYRYWRAVYYGTRGAIITNEMQLLNSSGVNLVTGAGGAASASHSNQAEALAFDGNDATAWATIGTGPCAWLQIDMLAEVDVANINIRTLGNNNQPSLGVIVASHNGLDFDVVSHTREMKFATDTYLDFLFPIVVTPLVGEGGRAGRFGATVAHAPAYTAIGGGSSGNPGCNGTGSISGNVDLVGSPNTPVARRVRLHASGTGELVRQTLSDAATGAYAFTGIDASQSYYVIALDHLHNYNAVVKDNVTPS